MEAPRLPSFFKARSPQSFDFKPRYYNERKERHQRMQAEQQGVKPPVSDFQSHWRAQRRHRTKDGQMLRLAVILAGLALAAWWLLQ